MSNNALTQYGGIYSETTAIRHALDYLGATAEHNGQPLTEAMLFGISGGIGFSYFCYENAGDPPTLYIGVAQRYKSRFGTYMGSLYKRLGLEVVIRMTKSSREAEEQLIASVAHERPVIIHVDRGYLPYYSEDSEFGDHAFAVVGYDGKKGDFIVADQAQVPILLSPSDLTFARESIMSLANRSLIIGPQENPIDLENGIQAGIKQCWDRMMSPPSPKENFGLTGMQEWMARLVNIKGKRGWPKIFSPGINLYTGLFWTYKCIQTQETGGGALRGMYADFLDEAAEVIGRKAFKEIAGMFRESAQLWSDFAHAALPDDVPLLKSARDLITSTETKFLEEGNKVIPEIPAIREQHDRLDMEAETDFPLDRNQSIELLANMSDLLGKVITLETEAIAALKEAAL